MKFVYHPRVTWWTGEYALQALLPRHPLFWWALAGSLVTTGALLFLSLRGLRWRRALAGAIVLGCVGAAMLGAGKHYEAQGFAESDKVMRAVRDLWGPTSREERERIASGADREAREAWSRWVYLSVVPFGVALALLAQAAALGFVPALREER